MTFPFTRTEFLGVFADYNAAIWPIQLLLIATALLAVGIAILGGRRLALWPVLLLAVLWDWMGVVYHWGYFARINPVAYAFGAAFVVQSAMLLWFGMVRRRLAFSPRFDVPGVTGGILIAYALIGYPLVGATFGHAYPHAPTFGVPCPTVIFTFGLVLWLEGRVPLSLLAIPTAWAVIGTSAAASLGMVEDFGLTAAGLLGLLGVGYNNRRADAASRGPVVTSVGSIRRSYGEKQRLA